jgi:sulfhydrogenase subunit alpha
MTNGAAILPSAGLRLGFEEDLRAFVPAIAERPEAEIAHFAEMLVRAYDPCISCSVHAVVVKSGEREVRSEK